MRMLSDILTKEAPRSLPETDKEYHMIYDEISDKIPTPRYIPLAHQSKKPKGKWGGTEPLAFTGKETSYGIDCGASGLVVVDCDVKNDLDGVSAFMGLCEESGGIPDTYTVSSPNGGLHFYFLADRSFPVKTTAGTRLGPGIDIRAYGGYIVGPGSTIRLENGQLGTYDANDDELPIAPIPTWLREKLYVPDEKAQGGTVSLEQDKKQKKMQKDSPGGNNMEAAEKQNAIAWAITQMQSSPAGQRNAILNKTAYFLGCKRVTEEDASKLIDEAMAIGLTAKEAQDTFKSGYSSGLDADFLSLDSIVKQYNTEVGKSFKDDPLDTEFYSNISLAYNFYRKHEDEVFYWIPLKQWYRYNPDKGIWHSVDEVVIRAMVQRYLEELILEIRAKHPRLSVTVYRAQERLWSKNTVESVAGVAIWYSLTSDNNIFDRDPYLINCKNGVYNLATKELEPHSPSHYITKYIGINLNLDAKDDSCDKILDSIHPEEREYMQLIAGQALTGDQPIQQACFFLHGGGSNGKSTFLDLLLRTSGDYGMLQPSSVLSLEPNKENYALASFEGLRTAVVEELPNSKLLNMNAVKQISGTQQISAREIYGKQRRFENASTVFISCNRLPMVNDTDHGTWRRLVVFTFPFVYRKRESEVKGKWDRLGDSRILYAANRNRLTAEAFLAWRVRGAMRWHDKRTLEYDVPQHIQDVVLEWNENNDVMLAWFRDHFTVVSKHYVLFTDLFNSYNDFLLSRGNSKVSMRNFSEALKKHKVFTDNNLAYVQRARPPKGYTHSPLPGTQEDLPERPSYVTGIAFS